jgi:hypothetical protein
VTVCGAQITLGHQHGVHSDENRHIVPTRRLRLPWENESSG